MSKQRKSADQPRIRLPLTALFVAFTCVAILALAVVQQTQLRFAELRSGEQELANLSRSLLAQTEDSLQIVDDAVLGVVHYLEAENISPGAIAKLPDLMRRRTSASNRLRGLFVYDENGEWVATSASTNISGHNNSDRDYFQHHKFSPSKDAYVGPPVRSRSGGQWIVTVSRRLTKPDGSFGGVVLGSIDAQVISNAFAGYSLGETGLISLVHSSGAVIARAPNGDTAIGVNVSNGPGFKSIVGPVGLMTFSSPIDGIERLTAYGQSARYPIILMVAKTERELLAGWQSQAILTLMLVVALEAMLIAAGIYLYRRTEQSNQTLIAKEAQFRLLAEASHDMVTRIAFDGTLEYVSPAAAFVVGWDADELVGTPALAGVNPDDRKHLDDAIAELREGRAQDAIVSYRTRHKTSGEVWLESSLQVTYNPQTGEVDGVVAVSRDVTEQKILQSELAALAATDGLTGIANRRRFDEAFAFELRNALAHNTKVTLLLIDVDNFKLFNDTYGHPAGDECLKKIANQLRLIASRPRDVAARYGGEEFAVLLPATYGEGARIVAERIRSSIEALNIPHAHGAAGQVTVSIGGAISAPHDAADSLLAAADRALYAAKAAGRNRVRFSAALIDIGLVNRAG